MPSLPLQFSARPNPFDCLRKHNTIIAIKAAVIPWLIAEFGINYGDWDNADTVTHMIADVITMYSDAAARQIHCPNIS